MASSYFRAENIRLPWSLSSTSVRLAVEYICLLMVLALLVPEGEENHESGLNFRALQFWTTLNLLCESRNSPALLVVLLFHLIKGLFSIAWEYFFIYVIALINGAHKPTHSKTLLQKLLPNQQRQQQLKNQSANHNFTFSPPRLIFPSFDFSHYALWPLSGGRTEPLATQRTASGRGLSLSCAGPCATITTICRKKYSKIHFPTLHNTTVRDDCQIETDWTAAGEEICTLFFPTFHLFHGSFSPREERAAKTIESWARK